MVTMQRAGGLAPRRPFPFGRRRSGPVELARSAARGLAALLILWQKRLRDRDALQRMTEAQLNDIGLRREDALREAEKPFWHR
jgi:uncharacterized protein YjiS (DUF1127 family)